MAYKVMVINAIIIIFNQEANALRCFECTSKEPNRACYDPIDLTQVPSEECNKNNSDITRYFGRNLDVPLLQAAEQATKYECVAYQMQTQFDNNTEMHRGCYPKLGEICFCDFMDIRAQFEKLNVTICKACNSDNCNGNEKNAPSSATNLQISAFLCLSAVFLHWKQG